MNVAVHAVDALIPNVALMKLSAWHKAQGDRVERFDPLLASVDPPDILYLSKQFAFSPDISWWPDCEIVRGGTAYDPAVKLPKEAENVYPDYELFNCEYAIGRITRGCPRRCPWCVVPDMDGNRVYKVAELEDFWRGQDYVRLMDDNLTADRDLFIETCKHLSRAGVATKFEALDIRFMTSEMAAALKNVKRWGRVHFAFDSMAVENDVRKGVAALKAGGFPTRQATFYVLIGFDTTPEQDMYRIELLESLGVESFAMPFDKSDPYQKRFARWVNAKPVFRSTSFDDYNSSAKRRTR